MKKALSIFLLVIFLVGNIGVTHASHYCGGEINEQSLLLIESEFGCGMEVKDKCEKEENSCSKHRKEKKEDSKSQNLKADNCCDNVFTELKVKENFDAQENKNLLNLDLVLSFVYSFTQPEYKSHVSRYTYYYKSPPLSSVATSVRLQTFLI